MMPTALDPYPSFDYWWDVIQEGAVVVSISARDATCVFRNPSGLMFQVDLFTDLAEALPSTQ